MHFESQAESNSRDRQVLGIQRELIVELCGKDRKCAMNWAEKHGGDFRKIIDENPQLVWEYPHTKKEIEGLLYGEIIH